MAILVTGGARSGKSGFAERCASRIGKGGVYVATCQPYDDEMKDRIGRHRSDRIASGFSWETVEEPFDVVERLDKLSERFGGTNLLPDKPPVVLLDCLTLWLTNWMLRLEDTEGVHDGLAEWGCDQDRAEGSPSERLQAEIDRLVEAIARFPYPLIVVTNEVGDGIVPSYALGRRFRDEAGRLNQSVAAVCERVFLVTAGIPVELKALAFRLEEL